MNRLSFEYSVSHAFSNPQAMLLPCIDGVPLNDLVKVFEAARGWSPAGGYLGLMPRIHCYGSIEDYFVGQSRSTSWNLGETALLACNCGIVTCWPFMALVEELDHEDGEIGGNAETADWLETEELESEEIGIVSWSAFEQPQRPERDYSAFGPFVFAREPYLQIVREAEARVLHSFEVESDTSKGCRS